jgi:muramidase (phage lysozyme)
MTMQLSARLFWIANLTVSFGSLSLVNLNLNEKAIAQSISNTNPADTCFMVTTSGKRVDLGYLCTKNPQIIPKPRPVQVNTNFNNSGFTNSGFTNSNFSGSANLKAFLMVIRYAEGTDSQDGYQIQYTGTRFYDFADHPRIARCGNIRGKSVCSTAAGAYQFLETTWDDVASAVGVSDFSPASQDRGAMELIYRAGAMSDVESGNIPKAIAKLANVWASFPRWSGDADGSYSQSVVSMDELLQVFRYYQQVEIASLQNIKQSKKVTQR